MTIMASIFEAEVTRMTSVPDFVLNWVTKKWRCSEMQVAVVIFRI